jgi:galactose mutarotase-like enzyme
MDNRKMGNTAQVRFAQEITIADKRCILVQNGALELLFNKDNALDIVWAKFKGVNLSFLSKNGLNDGKRDFVGNFEGGFLYTCGMDNVSGCVEGKPVHGSLHYKKCDLAYAYEKDGVLYVYGEVRECVLFGKNLLLKRSYAITENSLSINDTLVNLDYTDTEYVLLYHVNYGYPFLDECLQLDIPATNSDPLTEIAKERKADMFRITAPIDGGAEDVYYHTLSKGQVRLTNPDKNVAVEMLYDVNDFPVTLQWKSMISGDYAIGIEPSLTRFDQFKMQVLKANESKTYKIEINFQ